jgi:hypothetical protein
MTICTQKREVVYVCDLSSAQAGNWLSVVTLDKSFAPLSVAGCKIKSTRFAD